MGFSMSFVDNNKFKNVTDEAMPILKFTISPNDTSVLIDTSIITQTNLPPLPSLDSKI